jgi:hypothetical protein
MTQSVPTTKDNRPWAGSAGVLTACLVVGIGAWNGLEPDVILFRAVGGGAAIAVLTAVVKGIVTQSVRSK